MGYKTMSQCGHLGEIYTQGPRGGFLWWCKACYQEALEITDPGLAANRAKALNQIKESEQEPEVSYDK